MSYLVLARKHRPQTFEEVVGQKHITQTLKNAIEAKRVSHGILFSGPRGTGKTTIARILAKAMNCENRTSSNPCCKCTSCIEITEDRANDVFEIDGASNNTVEQIRDLKESVNYMPSKSPYKIYIIDEVHMLSISAFNALLKTLEEPPSHVMFLFATTEVNKIPITILSRCQKHNLKRIETNLLINHLENICSKENVEISKEAVETIAYEADGSVRDSLSLLDQVMSAAENKITLDYVLNTLALVDKKMIFDIAGSILTRDISKIINTISESYEKGIDIKKIYNSLIKHFRNLCLFKMKLSKSLNLSQNEIAMLENQAKNSSNAFLNQILNLLFKEEAMIKYSSHPKMALELVFMKLFQIKPAVSIDEVINKLDEAKKNYPLKNENDFTQKKEVPKDNTIKSEEKKIFDNQEKLLKEETNQEEISLDKTYYTKKEEKNLENCLKEYAKIDGSWASLENNMTKCFLKKNKAEIHFTGNGNNFVLTKQKQLEDFISNYFERKINVEIILNENKKDNKKNDEVKTFEDYKEKTLQNPMLQKVMKIFEVKPSDVDIKSLQEITISKLNKT